MGEGDELYIACYWSNKRLQRLFLVLVRLHNAGAIQEQYHYIIYKTSTLLLIILKYITFAFLCLNVSYGCMYIHYRYIFSLCSFLSIGVEYSEQRRSMENLNTFARFSKSIILRIHSFEILNRYLNSLALHIHTRLIYIN